MKTPNFAKFLARGVLAAGLAFAQTGFAAPEPANPSSQPDSPASSQIPVAPPGIFQQRFAPETASPKISASTQGTSVRADFSGANKQIPANTFVSFWTAEVMKLAQAAIDDQITCAFIDSVGTFNLGSEQIVFLHRQGVSDRIIRAMIQHDRDIARGLRPATTPSAPLPNVSLPFTLVAKNEQNVSSPVDSIGTEDKAETHLNLFADATPDSAQLPLVSGTMDSRSSATGRAQSASEQLLTYPLRQPHAVQLTSPIVLIPAAGRPANVITVSLIP